MKKLEDALVCALSSSDGLRSEAEVVLRKLESADGVEFLCALGQVLANEASPTDTRRVAGIVLKNSLMRSIDVTIASPRFRDLMENICSVLSDSNRHVRRCASQLAAEVATYEIMNRHNGSTLMYLLQRVQSSESQDALVESSLEAIAFTNEELSGTGGGCAKVLGDHTIRVLEVVISRLRGQNNSPVVQYAAVNALLYMLDFLESPYGSSERFEEIMGLILELADSPTVEIRLSAFKCITTLANTMHRRQLGYMDMVFSKTERALLYDDETVAVEAIEFWCAVASVELEVLERLASAGNHDYMQAESLIAPFAKRLTSDLLSCLLRQEEFQDEDTWNKAAAAGQCLQLLTGVSPTTVTEFVAYFIDENIGDENSWRRRFAATRALSVVSMDPLPRVVEELIDIHLPFLLIALLNDESTVVRRTTALTVARICKVSRKASTRYLLEIAPNLCAALDDDKRIAAHACEALFNIAVAFDSVNEPSPHDRRKLEMVLPPILSQMMRLVDQSHSTAESLRAGALSAIANFVRIAPPNSMNIIAEMGPVLLQRLQFLCQQQPLSISEKNALMQSQANLCIALGACCSQLESKCEPFLMPTKDLIIQLVMHTSDETVKENALQVIQTLIRITGKMSVKIADEALRVAFAVMTDCEKGSISKESFIAAVGVVEELARALEWDFRGYAADTVRVLCKYLQDSEVNWVFKPCMISGFGEIATAVKGEFRPYLNELFAILREASYVILNTKFQESDHMAQGVVLEFRHSILRTSSQILDIFPNNAEVVDAAGQMEWMITLCEFVCNDKSAFSIDTSLAEDSVKLAQHFLAYRNNNCVLEKSLRNEDEKVYIKQTESSRPG